MALPEPSTELVIVRLRPHVRTLLFPALALVFVSGLLGLWLGNLPEPWMNQAVGGVGAFVALFFSVVPLLRWLATRYTLTTRRMIVRSGLLHRRRAELLHASCPGLRVDQSAGQRLFGCGDIRVGGEGQAVLWLRDVPKARLVREAWQEEIWHAQGLL